MKEDKKGKRRAPGDDEEENGEPTGGVIEDVEESTPPRVTMEGTPTRIF